MFRLTVSKINSFSDMQRIVSTSAGETLKIEVDRGGEPVTLEATPAARVKDNFGNVHRIGVLGISRSMAPGDMKTEPVGPLQAVVAGVKETWFVVDRPCPISAGSLPGGRLPISSAGRSGSPRCPGRWRPLASLR